MATPKSNPNSRGFPFWDFGHILGFSHPPNRHAHDVRPPQFQFVTDRLQQRLVLAIQPEGRLSCEFLCHGCQCKAMYNSLSSIIWGRRKKNARPARGAGFHDAKLPFCTAYPRRHTTIKCGRIGSDGLPGGTASWVWRESSALAALRRASSRRWSYLRFVFEASR
jgi:hypothetical protein